MSKSAVTDQVGNKTDIRIINCDQNFLIDDQVWLSNEPIVLRNLVAAWPVVKKARMSTVAAVDYILQFYSGIDVVEVRGDASIKGRIAYSDDFKQLNCSADKKKLEQVFADIEEAIGQPDPPLCYMGTTSINALLPGFSVDNNLNIANQNASAFMWIGNRSCVPAHFDFPDNIACNIVGRRRFTLFSPDQLPNLYVGPLDFTPAGQAISLVDIRCPDLKKYPNYIRAQQSALVVELEPGDALFLPSMWWHNVEGLDDLNILVNYWWRQSPAFMGSPADVLEMAILSIRDLPDSQKRAWRGLLDHYVFNNNSDTVEHIPEHARGSLGELNETLARKIKAKVLARFNR